MEGPSQILPHGDRYAYLEREHRSVAAALLADELEACGQQHDVAYDAEADELKQMATGNGKPGKVVMVWKDLGATIANYLGYDESKADIETDSEPVVRLGPRKDMGSRFRELYAEHFVIANVPLEPDHPPSKVICSEPLTEESSEDTCDSESDVDKIGLVNALSNSTTVLSPPTPILDNQLQAKSPLPERISQYVSMQETTSPCSNISQVGIRTPSNRMVYI
jgi:hypothetical protein